MTKEPEPIQSSAFFSIHGMENEKLQELAEIAGATTDLRTRSIVFTDGVIDLSGVPKARKNTGESVVLLGGQVVSLERSATENAIFIVGPQIFGGDHFAMVRASNNRLNFLNLVVNEQSIDIQSAINQANLEYDSWASQHKSDDFE